MKQIFALSEKKELLINLEQSIAIFLFTFAHDLEHYTKTMNMYRLKKKIKRIFALHNKINKVLYKNRDIDSIDIDWKKLNKNISKYIINVYEGSDVKTNGKL